MQHGEALVLRPNGDAPVGLKVIKKRLHQLYIDVLQAKPFEGDAALVAAEPQEQAEPVSVGMDRVRAQVAL